MLLGSSLSSWRIFINSVSNSASDRLLISVALSSFPGGLHLGGKRWVNHGGGAESRSAHKYLRCVCIHAFLLFFLFLHVLIKCVPSQK